MKNPDAWPQTMRTLFLLASLFLPFLAPIQCAEHLYALIACDTLSSLRMEVVSNKANMLKILETISSQTGLTLHTKILTGKDLTEKAIYAWLDEVREDPQGVALFSYSGHGYRTESCAESVPFLFFSEKAFTFRTDAFYHKLESVGQRLTILLLDCCNSYDRKRLHEKSLFQPNVRDLPGMKTLFLETRGTIIFMGAVPGETSWYYYGQGGVFTSSFIQSLFEETRKQDATWSSLFTRTYRLCAPRQQHPFSLLNISPVLREREDTP